MTSSSSTALPWWFYRYASTVPMRRRRVRNVSQWRRPARRPPRREGA